MFPQLILIVLAATSNTATPTTSNLIMTNTPNPHCSAFICSLEMCLPVFKEACDGEIRENATFCGCCPNCIQYIDRGRPCGKHGSDFPEEPTTMCRPPLVCVDGYCNDKTARGGRRPRVAERNRTTPQYREQIRTLNFILWN